MSVWADQLRKAMSEPPAPKGDEAPAPAPAQEDDTSASAGPKAPPPGQGQERPGHKYTRREPLPGGGYRYFYGPEGQEQSRDIDDSHWSQEDGFRASPAAELLSALPVEDAKRVYAALKGNAQLTDAQRTEKLHNFADKLGGSPGPSPGPSPEASGGGSPAKPAGHGDAGTPFPDLPKTPENGGQNAQAAAQSAPGTEAAAGAQIAKDSEAAADRKLREQKAQVAAREGQKQQAAYTEAARLQAELDKLKANPAKPDASGLSDVQTKHEERDRLSHAAYNEELAKIQAEPEARRRAKARLEADEQHQAELQEIKSIQDSIRQGTGTPEDRTRQSVLDSSIRKRRSAAIKEELPRVIEEMRASGKIKDTPYEPIQRPAGLRDPAEDLGRAQEPSTTGEDLVARLRAEAQQMREKNAGWYDQMQARFNPPKQPSPHEEAMHAERLRAQKLANDMRQHQLQQLRQDASPNKVANQLRQLFGFKPRADIDTLTGELLPAPMLWGNKAQAAPSSGGTSAGRASAGGAQASSGGAPSAAQAAPSSGGTSAGQASAGGAQTSAAQPAQRTAASQDEQIPSVLPSFQRSPEELSAAKARANARLAADPQHQAELDEIDRLRQSTAAGEPNGRLSALYNSVSRRNAEALEAELQGAGARTDTAGAQPAASLADQVRQTMQPSVKAVRPAEQVPDKWYQWQADAAQAQAAPSSDESAVSLSDQIRQTVQSDSPVERVSTRPVSEADAENIRRWAGLSASGDVATPEHGPTMRDVPAASLSDQIRQTVPDDVQAAVGQTAPDDVAPPADEPAVDATADDADPAVPASEQSVDAPANPAVQSTPRKRQQKASDRVEAISEAPTTLREQLGVDHTTTPEKVREHFGLDVPAALRAAPPSELQRAEQKVDKVFRDLWDRRGDDPQAAAALEKQFAKRPQLKQDLEAWEAAKNAAVQGVTKQVLAEDNPAIPDKEEPAADAATSSIVHHQADGKTEAEALEETKDTFGEKATEQGAEQLAPVADQVRETMKPAATKQTPPDKNVSAVLKRFQPKGKDDPQLQKVFSDVKDGVRRQIATDRHRMVIHTAPAPGEADVEMPAGTLNFDSVIPQGEAPVSYQVNLEHLESLRQLLRESADADSQLAVVADMDGKEVLLPAKAALEALETYDIKNGDVVTAHVYGTSKPIKIEGPSFTHVIMPVPEEDEAAQLSESDHVRETMQPAKSDSAPAAEAATKTGAGRTPEKKGGKALSPEKVEKVLSKFVSKDPTRSFAHNVVSSVKDGVRTQAATDGRRLVLHTEDAKGAPDEPFPATFPNIDAILPRGRASTSLGVTPRLLDEAKAAVAAFKAQPGKNKNSLPAPLVLGDVDGAPVGIDPRYLVDALNTYKLDSDEVVAHLYGGTQGIVLEGPNFKHLIAPLRPGQGREVTRVSPEAIRPLTRQNEQVPDEGITPSSEDARKEPADKPLSEQVRETMKPAASAADTLRGYSDSLQSAIRDAASDPAALSYATDLMMEETGKDERSARNAVRALLRYVK